MMRGVSWELWSRALLSVQRALLGEVTPEMRAISLELSQKVLRVTVFIDGLVDEDLVDDFDSAVITQIIADFPEPDRDDPAVEFEFIRADVPAPLEPRGRWVYFRKE
jgi:hypothetical protein